jgi:hypothetical protein
MLALEFILHPHPSPLHLSIEREHGLKMLHKLKYNNFPSLAWLEKVAERSEVG